jgi:CubicO group peptidase (beta-lactamase class C family)
MRNLAAAYLVLLIVAAVPLADAAGFDGTDAAWPQAKDHFDAYFKDALPRHAVPGAVFVLVQGGAIRVLEGYGYADLAAGVPVDPGTTLFRIGSISKLITTTAAMQCVERGLLDLHRDVNAYLEAFQVPGTYTQPITLHHLLTHTAGFDDRFLALGVMDPASREPLSEYLARRLPPRVQPPGDITNYSNFGIVLAAHLVEQAAGTTFDRFVDENICEPLGMSPGGFGQPLLPELAARLARSYVPDGDTFVPAAWQEAASQVWPAGAFAATAPDMVRFMIAHLQGGELGSARILRPETAAMMHARQFINHPGLTRGQCYGFHERVSRGIRFIWHTGRVNRFTAQLVLAPELDAGFFAAFNSDAGDQTRTELFRLFVELLAGGSDVHAGDSREVAEPGNITPFLGTYRQVRRVRSTFLKIAFFGQDVILSRDADDRLAHRRLLGPHAASWLPVATDVFRAPSVPGQPHMAFLRDDAGHVRYACIETEQFTAVDTFERIARHETSLFHILLLAPAFVVLLSMLVRTPFTLREFRTRTRLERWCALLAGAGSLCLTGFAAGLGLVIALGDPYRFAFGLPPVILILLALPLLAAPCACGLLALVLLSWKRCSGSRSSRLHYAAVCLAAIAVLWSLHYWNLLGYKM